MKKNKKFSISGFTLIESMIVVFIVAVTSLAFYSVFGLGTRYIIESKNRLGAVALANERMEIIRNLDYENIGTKKSDGDGGYVYGIPAGEVLEDETVTKDNREYYVHTLVQYVDDEYDGTEDGSVDDEIPLDYKKVRVEVAWSQEAETVQEVSLVSTFVPQGIEKAEEGGTLSINVIDNEGLGIPQASVHISNQDEGIDVNVTTDDSGNIIFPGSPAGEENYAIDVSKSGYTSVSTFPSYPDSDFYPEDVHASVVDGKLNVKSIITDEVSTLKLRARDPFGNNVGDVSFDLEGGRKLGETDDGLAEFIFDFDESSNFDSNGEKDFNSVSYGKYTFTPTDETNYYFIKLDNNQLEANEIDLPPGDELTVNALFGDRSVNSLVVKVMDSEENFSISDAQIKLKRDDISFESDLVSDQYGQAFFPEEMPALESGTYTLSVEATGFASYSQDINIENLVVEEVFLEAQ